MVGISASVASTLQSSNLVSVRPAAPSLSANLSEYRAQDVATLTINDAPAQVGRQPAAAGDQTWILEAQTSSGQTFSLQAPAGFTPDRVIRIAQSVTYRQ